MRVAMCQYSFHRRWAAEGWTPDRYAAEVAALGVEGIDFHTRLAGEWLAQPQAIRDAVARHGLFLAGLSFTNSFLQADAAAFMAEVERVRGWIRAAEALGATTARVFGGWLPDERRLDPIARRGALQQVIDGLGAVIGDAERAGVTLALENHGCLPGTSAEVMQVLGAIASPRLKATIDLGNWLQAGEDPAHAAAALARHAAYVHVKGMRKVPDERWPWGWRCASAVPGEGDVDLVACFAALRRWGFSGVIGIEYEAEADEAVGVPASVRAVRAALAATAPATAAAT